MATLLDSRTLVRNNISQPTASTSDFADSELNGFVDQGIRFLAPIVKKPIKRTSFQVAVDTANYAVATYASDLIIPTKAYFGDTTIPGDVKPMRIIPEEELAEMHPGWLDATSSSQDRPRILVRDGANILIYPRPTTAESAVGKKVFLSYIYQPTALTVDGSTLDLPIVYHDLVASYATHLCYVGKLNNTEKGLAIKAQVVIDAKKLENLIIKESESPGFYWGNAIDPDDDSTGTLVP